MGKHTPAHMRGRIQSWSRRRKLAAAGGVAAAAVAGFAVAWALLALRADIDGGGNITAPAAVEFTAASVTSESSVDCVVTPHDGDLTLQMNEGLTGGTCDVSMTLRRTGQAGQPQYITDLEFSDSTDEGYLNGACNSREVTTAGTTVQARFTLTGPAGVFTARPDAGVSTSDDPVGLGGAIQGCPIAS